jgi:hypothetical protein
MLKRPQLIYLATLAGIVGLVFVVHTQSLKNDIAPEVIANRALWVSNTGLLVLAAAALALRHQYGAAVSLASSATLIQGISIAFMIMGISSPMRALFAEGRTITPEQLMALIYPLAQTLATMGFGVVFAVVLNFMDDHLAEPPHCSVSLGDVDAPRLQSSLEALGAGIEKVQTRMERFVREVDGGAHSFAAMGETASKLRTAIDQTGTLLEQINIFVDATRVKEHE